MAYPDDFERLQDPRQLYRQRTGLQRFVEQAHERARELRDRAIATPQPLPSRVSEKPTRERKSPE
ncbi:MAG: hypothetical protein LC791_16595 [Acidobacteria bacterium]|nr:hypothetical protein [Acidobacteriota bacterium]